jgi:thioredoxin-like negative regulator of GroEL
MLAKVLEDVKTEVPIESYDIDEHEQYAKEFHIRGVPTLIMMDENVEVKRKSGLMNKAELEVWLNG